MRVLQGTTGSVTVVGSGTVVSAMAGDTVSMSIGMMVRGTVRPARGASWMARRCMANVLDGVASD